MAIDPTILAAVATAERVSRGNNARLPLTTDRQDGAIVTGNPVTTGAPIPPYVRELAQALLQVAEAVEAAGFMTVQKDNDTAIANINLLNFRSGPIVTDLGDNKVSVEMFGPLDPGQLLGPVRVATTTEIAGGVYTVDAGGPFLDQISVPAVPTIDGVNVWSIGDRLLVKDQTTGAQNGVYEVIQVGPPWIIQRTADYSGNQEPGQVVQSLEGTTNAGVAWQQTSPDTNPVVVGGAAGDTLVFGAAPAISSAGKLWEATIGAAGDYTTIANAITGFAAGDWGDGVNFKVWFLDAGAADTTDWTGLPATCKLVDLRTCVAAGPITVTDGFAGSFRAAGPITIDVDATWLAGQDTGTYVEITDDAFVTSTLNPGGWDIIRSDAGVRDLTVTNGARIEEFRNTGATTVPAIATTTVRVDDAELVSTGTEAGSSGPLMANDSTLSMALLTMTGTSVVTNCAITMTNTSAANNGLTTAGVFRDTTVTVTRDAGGIAFVFVLTGYIAGCTFSVVDGGGAVGGLISVLTTATTVFERTTMPGNTALGSVSYGPFSPASFYDVTFPSLDAVVLSSATPRVEQLTIVASACPISFFGPYIRDISITSSLPAGSIDIGNDVAEDAYVDGLYLDLSGAVAPTVGINGRVIRNVHIKDPDATNVTPTNLRIGNVTALAEESETVLISGLTYESTGGGGVGSATYIQAQNVEDVTWRQTAAGTDATGNMTLVYTHCRRINVAGVLNLSPWGFSSDPQESEVTTTATDIYATGASSILGSAAIVSGAVQSHVLTNCFFADDMAFNSIPALPVDLQMTNVRVAGTVTQANPYRDIAVASSIASTPFAFTAGGTKAIGASVIGFS